MEKDNFAVPKSCTDCQGSCCRHVALEIDKPTTKQEFDNIRWYLMHKGVEVFVDHDGGWYVKFTTDCEHVNAKHACDVYETRPEICRDYPAAGHECEFEGEGEYFKVIFRNAAEYEEYMDSRRKNWRIIRKKPSSPSPKPKPKPKKKK